MPIKISFEPLKYYPSDEANYQYSDWVEDFFIGMLKHLYKISKPVLFFDILINFLN
jgi:hypothetical protein